MKCNGCTADQDVGAQCIATECGHLYCVECARGILESDESACRICDAVVVKKSLKAVRILQTPSDCQLLLCGQAPETALSTALASVNFYLQQQQLLFEEREAVFKKKLEKTETAARAKLKEVHAGYTQAKRKYQEVAQLRKELEHDNRELQEKYQQKALQTKKLQDMYRQLQQENEMLRGRGGGGSHGGGGGLGRANPGAPLGGGRPQTISPGLGGPMMTVHRKQAILTNGQPMSPGALDGRTNYSSGFLGRPQPRLGGGSSGWLEPGFPRRSSVSPMRGGSETMLPDLGSPGPGHVGGANPQALRQLLNGGGGSGGGGGGGYRRQSFGGSPYMPSGAPSGLASL